MSILGRLGQVMEMAGDRRSGQFSKSKRGAVKSVVCHSTAPILISQLDGSGILYSLHREQRAQSISISATS